MFHFFLGVMCGGLIGCFIMALLQASGKDNIYQDECKTPSFSYGDISDNSQLVKEYSARQFVSDVEKLAKEYQNNFFVVTDGASGYSNNNLSSAIKNARDAHIRWEKEHGFNPNEDWSKERKADGNDY